MWNGCLRSVCVGCEEFAGECGDESEDCCREKGGFEIGCDEQVEDFEVGDEVQIA